MAKVRALEKVRDEGRTPKPGSRWTVTQWLEHWLENVARPSVRVRSAVGCDSALARRAW